ncbi:hypothetical protein [Streptomyces sp. NPDC087437]|uniref:hypothetical protein n=1 Tax=Streptomyces sp. NPDC087437 TaxID=3365789 RepID=UPI00381D35E1
MQRVQEMLVPEGVFALLAAVAAIGAREWRRVQLAREKRREREQELLAAIVAEVAAGEREVQVRHSGLASTWSLTDTVPSDARCRGASAQRPGAGELHGQLAVEGETGAPGPLGPRAGGSGRHQACPTPQSDG